VDGVVQHALTDTPLLNNAEKRSEHHTRKIKARGIFSHNRLITSLQQSYIQQCIESYGVVSYCIAANSFIHLLYHPCKSLCIFPTIPPQTTLLPFTSHTSLSPPPHSTTSHLITLRRRVWRGNRRSPRLAVWARRLLCEAEYNIPHSSHRVLGKTGERDIRSGL
jgi:hypothetical protein